MTTRGKGGASLTHHDGATTTIGLKRPTREEKRPILLSLLFICFLSVVAVFARISSSPPSSLVFIGKSSASEDDDDDGVLNNNENTRNYDEEAEDGDAHFLNSGFRSARERGNDGTMRETLLRKCSRQRFRRGREDDEEDADDEETQREQQEQERRVQKSWIFQTNAKRLGYVHMASIHPVATKTRRKDDDDDGKKVLLAAWQGAHKVEGTDDQSLFVSKSADGGATWTKARVVPGRKFGVRWAPTFFSSSSSGSNSSGGGGETTYLFYAESEKCWHCESGECEDIVRKRKNGSEEEDVSVYWDESKEGIVSKAKKAASVGPWWRPGGNIKRVSIRINDDEDGDINDDPWTFGEEETILSEETIPKVIGNPPLKLNNVVLLPFWREHPRADAKCQPRKAPDYASVLHSLDDGLSFHETDAKIEHVKNKMKDGKPDWLIEGSIVGPLRDGRLAQFFRTSRGAIYVSHSADNGESWDTPHATPLQNPNSKVSAVLLPNGVIVVCHNAHAFMKHPRIGVTRGKLALSTSSDDGRTWKEAVLFIEDSLEPGKHVHYPTMVLDGCDLRISYSVSGEGVKLATVKDWASLHEIEGIEDVDEQRIAYY